MKIRISDSTKTLILCLIIPLGVGLLSYLLTKNSIAFYTNNLQKPFFAPPPWLFSVVWPILYILMGISSYLIAISMSSHKSCCLVIYALNLILNFLWPIIFFNLEAHLFAFVFIIFLDIVVLYMIICFKGISKLAAYLQIPYFIWLIFASILNLSVYFLNR